MMKFERFNPFYNCYFLVKFDNIEYTNSKCQIMIGFNQIV